jgi:predicted pyridoxine 5'-phosphate oxidase superfamily flavin-nucleotide-binding protein
MKLSEELKACMSKSVLCWLATTSRDNSPNVSPKEIFTHYNDDCIIVANIASPQTVKNIQENPQVCISFLDILVQKGYQVKGKAEILTKTHNDFPDMENLLTQMTQGKFPFATITKITLEQVKSIIAPRYLLYPETTEEEQIESARKAYGF